MRKANPETSVEVSAYWSRDCEHHQEILVRGGFNVTGRPGRGGTDPDDTLEVEQDPWGFEIKSAEEGAEWKQITDELLLFFLGSDVFGKMIDEMQQKAIEEAE